LFSSCERLNQALRWLAHLRFHGRVETPEESVIYIGTLMSPADLSRPPTLRRKLPVAHLPREHVTPLGDPARPFLVIGAGHASGAASDSDTRED
jgi:hypothetical protein